MRRIAWTHYAAPQTFYGLAGVCWKPLALLALALALAGMWVGFMVAPTDAQQGEGYRIIFVHVPVSWMSMIIYLAMAFWGVVCLVFRARMGSGVAANPLLHFWVRPVQSGDIRVVWEDDQGVKGQVSARIEVLPA